MTISFQSMLHNQPMNLKNIQHTVQASDISTSYNYKGIPIFSTYGIHENIFTSFLKLKLPHNTSILILGAGAGGFDQRLLDNGYANITATELIPESYLVKGTKLVEFDLNNDFSTLGTFDVIIALEIIEHVENQFHFIRCVKACLKENGVLYLSSPNVESTFSRAKFFAVGRLHFFSKEELYNTGHITPIFNHILRFNLERSHLKIEEYFTNGNIWLRSFQHPNILLKAAYLLFFILSLGVVNKNNFDINLYKITHV